MGARSVLLIALLVDAVELVSLALGAAGPARIWGTLAFFLLVPGAALWSVTEPLDWSWFLGRSFAVGFAVLLLGGEAMLLMGAWNPRAFALLVGWACGVLLVLRLSVWDPTRRLRSGA
jgi:hypothetical protein